MEGEKKSLKQKAENELRELGIVCGYLFLVFLSAALQRSVIADQQGIAIKEYGFALINALAIGKVMLIAKQLHFAQRPGQPLYVSVILQSAAFAVLLLICKVIEDVGFDMYKGKTLAESLPHPGGRPLIELGALTIAFFLSLLPFFAFSELSGSLGEGALAELFLKPKTKKI